MRRVVAPRLEVRPQDLVISLLGAYVRNPVWIAPHDHEQQVRQLAQELDLVGHCAVFDRLYAGLTRAAQACFDAMTALGRGGGQTATPRPGARARRR